MPLTAETQLPQFTHKLDGDRGDDYPEGIRYQVVDLARDGQIRVASYRANIDPAFEGNTK